MYCQEDMTIFSAPLSEYALRWRFPKKGHSNGGLFAYGIDIDGIGPGWRSLDAEDKRRIWLNFCAQMFLFYIHCNHPQM